MSRHAPPKHAPGPPPAASAAPARESSAGEPRWQVRLLGTVEMSDGLQRIDRFPSRAVAALMARLALGPDRSHPREELVELLWPGVSLAVGRNRLRQTLSTLKSLLEPAGMPGSAVIQADRLALRLCPGALACDALAFERLARAGRAEEARALYGGELMPGHYDEWIDDERQRLAALYERMAARAGERVTPAASSGVPGPDPAFTPERRRAASAPALTLGYPPLPTYLTRLYGADMATARLRALVLSQRLVTLLGPGGSGKTRLGVEVAQALAQFNGTTMWPGSSGTAEEPVAAFGRIAFVPLAACEEAPQFVDALARALQLPGSDGRDEGLARLRGALGGQRVLLVLDNFEQLVGRAERLVGELLADLPGLHVLVTSRRALGLDGERSISAEPLPLPAADAPLSAAAANPAVALFVDRARAARADFHLTERNHSAIVALVRRLHGMPLAIELAASRVRSVPPSEMVALLSDEALTGPHLALLARSGPRAGHDPRHASMAQVIAWSWRLLDATAQQVLAALAVFPADASVEFVAAVAGLEPLATAMQLDALVGHSLVRTQSGAEGAEGAARFGLIEPVREFVVAQEEPGAAEARRTRLRSCLVVWARRPGVAATPARVAPELATVHAALAQGADALAAHHALDLALALRSYWDTDGLPGRLQQALEAALAHVDDALLRADAHELLAYLRFESGFAAQAADHAEASIRWAGEDPSRRARALVRRAWLDIAGGRSHDRAGPRHAAAERQLQEALDLARGAGDLEAQARALHQMAVLTAHVQVERRGADLQRAEALMEQSQSLWLQLGDRRKAMARLRNRAQIWMELGRREQARECFELCEQAARDDGDWVGQIDSQISLTSLLAHERRWADALAVNRRCIALAWQRWHRHGLAFALWNPPRLLARLRRPAEAMRLMGFAAAFWTAGFGVLSRSDEQYVRRVRRLVQAQLGRARAETLWLEGAAMDTAAAVALALAD